MIGDKTRVGNLDHKMDMLAEQLNQCVKSFHTPLSFMVQVDALIQSLRNYTFTIQANKKEIPNFDTWYDPWQERMKKDEYLNWLNQKRIDVVHGDVLTTKSNAVLTLDTDHTERLSTKRFSVMTGTEDIVKNAQELAEEHPALRHATGRIVRHYIFEVNEEDVEVLDFLSACFAFIQILRADLARYLKDGQALAGDLPPIKGKFKFPARDLEIMFKLRDGSVLSEKAIRIKRKDLVKDRKEVDEHYGGFRPKGKLRSLDKLETIRAHFELARHIFETDGHHIGMMHVHGKGGWSMVVPAFQDRAEKIAFWKSFAAGIKAKSIDEILYTTESWTYGDVKKGMKHIRAGKEIKSLRNKGETLLVHYLNKEGRVIVISAPISRTVEGVSLGDATEEEYKPEDFPIFYPIFVEWGLINISKVAILGGPDLFKDPT